MNRFLTILFAGAKMIAEEYSWSGVRSKVAQLIKRNRFASSRRLLNSELLLDLVESANAAERLKVNILQVIYVTVLQGQCFRLLVQ